MGKNGLRCYKASQNGSPENETLATLFPYPRHIMADSRSKSSFCPSSNLNRRPLDEVASTLTTRQMLPESRPADPYLRSVQFEKTKLCFLRFDEFSDVGDW